MSVYPAVGFESLTRIIKMNLILLFYGLCFLIHTCQLAQAVKPAFFGKEMDEFNLTTVEIIEKYGYPAETHKTTTEDGYILVLHRIPRGKNSTKPGFPILLAHSLILDSATYVLSGEKSFGFFLADQGYDVWLINFRGNHYTKTHKYLSADDSKFWGFSMNEFGAYDLPALIDYICDYTKNKDLILLGYSMGATAFFIMASERPEYQEKIRGAILLGPVASLKQSKAILRFIFVPLMTILVSISKPFSFGKHFEDSSLLQNTVKLVCNTTIINRKICKYGIFLMSGADPKGFDERTVLNLASHVSGTSTRVLEHYAQLFLTDKFQQYNYGMDKNMAVYGSPTPPEYHLERVTTPLSLFVGLHDIYATPGNIMDALTGVHSVRSMYVIPQPTFSHLDFIVGKHVEEVLYPEVARQLKNLITYGREGRDF